MWEEVGPQGSRGWGMKWGQSGRSCGLQGASLGRRTPSRGGSGHRALREGEVKGGGGDDCLWVYRLRSCRCFWTMTHNKENILLYKRTNTYHASLKTSFIKYAPERMIFSFLICSTPLHSNPCSFIQKMLDSLSWSYHEHSTSHSLCGVFFSNIFWKS